MRFRPCLGLLLGLLPLTAHAVPEILVPAYFDPSTDPGLWQQMTQAAASAPLTAIMNPNSGPGTAVDPSYTSAINSLRSAGGRVVGYVFTQGGDRAINSVKTDIDRYYSFYPMVDGIFLDEYESLANSADIAYYTDLYNYIKAKGGGLRTVIGNPGTATAEAYMATTDVLMIFEDPSDYSAATPDAYVTSGKYAASRFAMIQLNQGSSSGMVAQINLAQSRNTGVVFITNDTETGVFGNAYDTLPSYWSQEVAEVAARQGTAPPPPSSSGAGQGGSGGSAFGLGLWFWVPLVLRRRWAALQR